MSADNRRLEKDSKIAKLLGGVLHGFPVGLAAHDDSDKWLAHVQQVKRYRDARCKPGEFGEMA
jgi:hypothetical protein